jgi:hypothetical protein
MNNTKTTPNVSMSIGPKLLIRDMVPIKKTSGLEMVKIQAVNLDTPGFKCNFECNK